MFPLKNLDAIQPAKCALSHLIQGGDYMSIEENKAIVHRFVRDLWNAENPDVFDELVAADFISHNSTYENQIFPC